MSNIGAGLGTSYPTTLDTQTTPEVDSPSASATLARAAVPNDLAAAVIAIETALGTTPQGTKADVKTFLQVEHGTNGTHQVQLTMAAGSAAAPQIKSATDATGFFFPVNVIGVSIAGTERGRFTSTGLNNCVIGATTPQAGSFTTINASGAITGNVTGTATAATTATVNSDTTTNSAFPVVFSNGTGAGSTLKAAPGEFEYNPATNTLTLVDINTGTLSITQGAVISGTYTPTLVNSSNVVSSSAYVCQYMRVGSVVTVSGIVEATCASAGVDSLLFVSTPINTTPTLLEQCGGSGVWQRGNGSAVNITADSVTPNRVIFSFSPNNIAAGSLIPFSFTYLIV